MTPTAKVLENGERSAAEPLASLHDWLQRATPEQKNAAAYTMLHALLGDRVDQEHGIYDPDGNIYLYLLPPHLREELRFKANPQLSQELERGAAEPMEPLDKLLHEVGVRE